MYKADPEAIKIAEKSFNSNGYKHVKLMAFDAAMNETSKLQVGTVIGLVNPKPMKATVEYGFSFLLDAAASMFRIGFSEDIAFCKGQGNMTSSGFSAITPLSSCKQYLNKSIETLCDSHKLLQQTSALNKIRSGRNQFHSDTIDLNLVRKQQMIEDQEKRIGAFAGGRRTFANNNRGGPKTVIDP